MRRHDDRSTVCTVIVTRNRADLLEECLAAVAGQTRPTDAVLVVDNASTDRTPELLREAGVEVVRLDRNEGGAGGFHEGLKRGAQAGHGWLWLMDDDTIPAPDALEQLLDAPVTDAAMLASKVVWTDGRIHPMNPPQFDRSDTDALVEGFAVGAVPLRMCTFPSLLVRGDVPARHGLPRKEYFIWSDDIEYTARVLRSEPGYFVPASVAVHKTATAAVPWEGGERFFYAVRNGLWVAFGGALSRRERVIHLLVVAEQTLRFLRHERWRFSAIRIVARGLVAALRPPAR